MLLALPPSPANISTVNAAHLMDGKTDTDQTRPWKEETAAVCTLLLPDSEPQALSTRWGFQDPRGRSWRLQRGAGCERALSRAGSWPGSFGHGLRNTECRLGEGFEAARWPWALSKRHVSPAIQTHWKVGGGCLGPWPGAVNGLGWRPSWPPGVLVTAAHLQSAGPPAHCPRMAPSCPLTLPAARGTYGGSFGATSSGQKDVECGRGEGGLVSSEGPWRARGQRGAQGSPHRRQGQGGPLHRTLDMWPLSESGTGAPRHSGSPTPGHPHPAVSPPTRGPSTLQSLPSLAERPPTPDPVQAACGHLEVTCSGITTCLPPPALQLETGEAAGPTPRRAFGPWKPHHPGPSAISPGGAGLPGEGQWPGCGPTCSPCSPRRLWQASGPGASL